MRNVKLTKEEKAVEKALLNDEFVNVGKKEFEEIAKAVAFRKKDAVISLRVNSEDLKLIKKKAHKFGIRYQAFITELMHRVAHT